MEGENHISERDDVVIRFSGDSGDGMQMTGKLFTDTAALATIRSLPRATIATYWSR